MIQKVEENATTYYLFVKMLRVKKVLQNVKMGCSRSMISLKHQRLTIVELHLIPNWPAQHQLTCQQKKKTIGPFQD